MKASKKVGRKPYGHRPDELEVLQKIKRLRNIHHGERKTPHEITAYLNEHGIEPPAGQKWYTTTVKNILDRQTKVKTVKSCSKTCLEGTDYLDLHQAGGVYEILMNIIETAHRPRPLRRARIILTLLCTGLRNFELCDLRLRDVPFFHGKNEITVREGKGRKGGTIKISPVFRELLDGMVRDTKPREVLRNSTELVFRNEAGGKLSTDSLRHIVKGFGRNANLRFLHPHALRHTYGSILYFATKDIRLTQKQMRHSNMGTTEIYVNCITGRIGDQTPEAIKRVVEAIRPPENQIVRGIVVNRTIAI
jgi:integrase